LNISQQEFEVAKAHKSILLLPDIHGVNRD